MTLRAKVKVMAKIKSQDIALGSCKHAIHQNTEQGFAQLLMSN